MTSVRSATGLGFLAVLLWSTTIACSRGVSEKLGPVTSTAVILLAAGIISCLSTYRTREGRRALLALPRAYLWVCGLLFVLCEMAFFLAVGLSADGPQVVAAGVINYLWVALTLVFSVPLLGRKASWPLLPGILLALGGIAAAAASQAPAGSALDLSRSLLPYLLALASALTWSLYSNLARRWAAQAEAGAVPVFLLASGLAMLGLLPFFRETQAWSIRVALETAYVVLGPTIAAYTFWDTAMRRGDQVLVVAASYLVPLLSTLLSCLWLHVAPGPMLWLACAATVAGAVLCKLGIR